MSVRIQKVRAAPVENGADAPAAPVREGNATLGRHRRRMTMDRIDDNRTRG